MIKIPNAVLLAVAATLVACDPVADRALADWERATKTHYCTVEQMQRVHSEAKWCSDNTSMFSAACYGTAIMRNCAPKPVPEADSGGEG